MNGFNQLNSLSHNKNYGVREAQTLHLRIALSSYETCTLANCTTTPHVFPMVLDN